MSQILDSAGKAFMAAESLRNFAMATRDMATVLNETVGNMERRHTFYSSRLFFLIAANQAVDFGKWAVKTGAITADVISELLTVADDINELRNMNEHVLEYFQDKGRFQHEFIYATDQAIADASSTIEDRIGNRLSWKDVSDIMERLLHQLPGAAQTHATKSTL